MRQTIDSTYRLSEVIGALSHALDITEGQPVGHSQRSCMLGMEVAARLGLPDAMRRDLFYASLLKDAGCSSSAARMCELFAADDRAVKSGLGRLDWTSTAQVVRYAARTVAPDAPGVARAGHLLRALRGLAREAVELKATRCDRGARIASMMGFPAGVAEVVYSLDEHWDGSGRPTGLEGEAIPLLARIACLAQTVEIFLAADGPAAALDVVRQRRGRWFDPRLADVLLAIPPGDPLWQRVSGAASADAMNEIEPEGGIATADEDGLDRVAEAFAGVIDAKSPYTARHSTGVAAYSVAIGEALGLDDGRLRGLRRAGLLHDIGKLGVSNRILDKPGPLTDAEVAEVRLHPLYTHQILSRISAFAGIAEPAAAHHERLDGGGYHRGVGGEHLSLEARILAVADVYEALTADRPYRVPLTGDRALAIIGADAGTAFDPLCVATLGEVHDALGGVL